MIPRCEDKATSHDDAPQGIRNLKPPVFWSVVHVQKVNGVEAFIFGALSQGNRCVADAWINANSVPVQKDEVHKWYWARTGESVVLEGISFKGWR